VHSDRFKTIPQTEWADRIAAGQGDLSAGCKVILNQANYGDCWAFSETQAEMVDRALQGHSLVVLAPDPMVWITGNYNGGAIDDGLLQVMIPYGLPPASLCPQCDPVAGHRARDEHEWPASWKTSAAGYKTPKTEYLDCASPDELVTGIFNGHPAVVGVDWQGGGHAICALQVLEVRKQFYLAGPNSWGEQWASGWGSFGTKKPGWWLLSLQHISGGFGQMGAWVHCGQVTSPDEPIPAAA